MKRIAIIGLIFVATQAHGGADFEWSADQGSPFDDFRCEVLSQPSSGWIEGPWAGSQAMIDGEVIDVMVMQIINSWRYNVGNRILFDFENPQDAVYEVVARVDYGLWAFGFSDDQKSMMVAVEKNADGYRVGIFDPELESWIAEAEFEPPDSPDFLRKFTAQRHGRDLLRIFVDDLLLLEVPYADLLAADDFVDSSAVFLGPEAQIGELVLHSYRHHVGTLHFPGESVVGQGENCVADLDDDGEVGVNDFLTLLSAWGPCQ